jgi:integrase
MSKQQINVTAFLRQYESSNTRKSYSAGIQQFLQIIYPSEQREDLDSLSERYLREDRNHRDDILTFKESLAGKAPKTMISRLNAVRVFLDENGIIFPKRFFNNVNGKVTDPITEESTPTNEQLKRIVEYMPIQGKALTLVLASSGMRVNEALQLQDSDIELEHEPVRIRIHATYTKTGKRRISFMTSEAKDVLLEWLTFRQQYLESVNRIMM